MAVQAKGKKHWELGSLQHVLWTTQESPQPSLSAELMSCTETSPSMAFTSMPPLALHCQAGDGCLFSFPELG